MGRKALLYLITNTVNGKRYAGITNDTDRRWFKQHPKADSFIGRAIRKYGIENFTFEVLAEYETTEEVYAAEIAYIAEHNLTNREVGYNISAGGTGVLGVGFVPNVAYKIDGSYVGKFKSVLEAADTLGLCRFQIGSNLYKKQKQVSGYCFFRVDEEIPEAYFSEDNFGYKASGIASRRAIVVMDIETLSKEYYESVTAMSEKTGIEIGRISSVCVGKRKKVHGKVICYLEDEHQLIDRCLDADKGIVGTNMNTGEVIVLNSATEAKERMSVSPSHITECCAGKRKSAGGYTWHWRKEERRGLYGA